MYFTSPYSHITIKLHIVVVSSPFLSLFHTKHNTVRGRQSGVPVFKSTHTVHVRQVCVCESVYSPMIAHRLKPDLLRIRCAFDQSSMRTFSSILVVLCVLLLHNKSGARSKPKRIVIIRGLCCKRVCMKGNSISLRSQSHSARRIYCMLCLDSVLCLKYRMNLPNQLLCLSVCSVFCDRDYTYFVVGLNMRHSE